jgi:hypothetical protein
MSELQKNQDQMREKLALSPRLDEALKAAISQEKQQEAESPAVVAQVTAEQQEKAANIEGWKLAVLQAVPMIEAIVPEFREMVTRDQWGEFGTALGEACEHYGLSVGEALSHPLFRLAVAALPIGIAGYQIKQARIAAAIAQSKAGRVQAVATPEQEQRPMQTGAVAAGVTVRQMTADVPAS